MAFQQEDGSGLADANSYPSVQGFRDYWDDRGMSSLSSMGDQPIEVLLIKSTDFVDKRWGTQFISTKGSVTQRLMNPRAEGEDRQKLTRPAGVVYREVIEACIVYAGIAVQFNLLPTPSLSFTERGNEVENTSSGSGTDDSDTTTTVITNQSVIEDTIVAGPLRITEKKSPGSTTTKRINEQISRSLRQSSLDFVSEVHIPEYPEADLILQNVLRAAAGVGRITVGGVTR